MKRVLITGCSSGFGFELVAEYLRHGWSVIATLRNLGERKNLFIDLESKFPDRLKVLELDVSKKEDRQGVAKLLDQNEWTLDCLVNNAGYGLFGAFEDLSELQIREQFEVNFFGVLLLTQSLLPQLRRSKGRVIVVSSVVGYIAMPFGSLYSSSKFAVEGFCESLRHELEPFEVQVALVEPGQFRTSFSKKMKYGEISSDPFSPYYRMTKNFKKYRERRNGSRGVSSHVVVEQIVKMSNDSRMPMRVRCGVDAELGFWLKWLLPERFFEKLLRFIFRSMIFREH